ncbi:hypothetical protein ACTMTI_45740 [Nonomuraea sp. H19]|uniref:hypothetical protein n=1 Tax=Nonomuraea sp. H19 TaxID=3452206 RepID=UPI003F8BE446
MPTKPLLQRGGRAAGPATDEAGLIAVTPAEARRLFTSLLARTTRPSNSSSPGPAGDDATSTEPAPPATARLRL